MTFLDTFYLPAFVVFVSTMLPSCFGRNLHRTDLFQVNLYYHIHSFIFIHVFIGLDKIIRTDFF